MAALQRLWSLRRSRPVFFGGSVLLLSFFLVYPFFDVWLRSIDMAPEFRMWDFGAYGGAFNRWQAGEMIYERNAQGGFSRKYLYPPIALLLFWPFLTILPEIQTALADLFGGVVVLGDVVSPITSSPPKVFWAMFSLLFAWIGLQYAIRELGLDLARFERVLLLWVIVGYQPLLLSLKMGQMAAFQVGLLGFSLGALVGPSRESAWLSGAATSIVGNVKPSYSYVGAHLLADRDRFVGALGTGVILLLLSFLIFGIDSHIEYLEVIAWGVEKGNTARSPAFWFVPYYRPIAWIEGAIEGFDYVFLLRLVVAGLIIAGAVLARPRGDVAVFALGVAAFPLFTPKTYTYYLAGLLPAVIALLAVELRRDGRPAVLLAGLFLTAIHSPIGLFVFVDYLPDVLNLGEALRPFYSVLQIGLWGNAIIVGIAAVRVAQDVRRPRWDWLPTDRLG